MSPARRWAPLWRDGFKYELQFDVLAVSPLKRRLYCGLPGHGTPASAACRPDAQRRAPLHGDLMLLCRVHYDRVTRPSAAGSIAGATDGSAVESGSRAVPTLCCGGSIAARWLRTARTSRPWSSSLTERPHWGASITTSKAARTPAVTPPFPGGLHCGPVTMRVLVRPACESPQLLRSGLHRGLRSWAAKVSAWMTSPAQRNPATTWEDATQVLAPIITAHKGSNVASRRPAAQRLHCGIMNRSYSGLYRSHRPAA